MIIRMLNLIKSIMKTKTKPNRTKICNVTGIETSEDNFYSGHSHVKAVDNLRRVTGANKAQLRRMFNQLNTY